MYAKENVYLGIIEGINSEHNIKGQSQLRLQTCEGIQAAQEEGTGQEDAEPEESHPNIHNRSTLHDLKRTPWTFPGWGFALNTEWELTALKINQLNCLGDAMDCTKMTILKCTWKEEKGIRSYKQENFFSKQTMQLCSFRPKRKYLRKVQEGTQQN